MRLSLLSPLALFLLTHFAQAYTGEMTHYTPSNDPNAPGSCGPDHLATEGDMVVALHNDVMQNGANPNTNPKCGSKIGIWNPYTQTKHEATIVDTCGGCKTYDIDVSPALFQQVAPNGDGRVFGINWGGDMVGG
ncbi:MAG: hypothetical protein Q9166_000929 [cf. Caloplaca sp. 2 TL-2023]